MDIAERFDRFVLAGADPTYVVSVAHDGRRDACLVGFASQCSIRPLRFAVWLSKANRTWRIADEAPTVLAVHRLLDGDEVAAEWFGGTTGDDGDPFGDWATTPGPEGVPLIDALPERLVGREVLRLDTGDHVLIVLDPLEVHGSGHGRPFTVARAASIDPGHPA